MSQIKDYRDIVRSGSVFAALDVETTGLDCFHHEIIELSVLKYRNGSKIDVYSTLLDPERDIPEEAGKISGITIEMVQGKPKFREIYEHFLGFIEGAILVAHNAQFDLGFINSALAAAGSTYLANSYVDTLDMARKAFPGLPGYSLQKLASHFNIQVNAAHRAEDDARVCMELFYICNDKINPGGQISLF